MGQEVLARVFVPGHPRTKGSLKPVHIPGRGGRRCKVGLTEDKATTRPWMLKIVRYLRPGLELAGLEPYLDAVQVDCFFRYERSMSAVLEAADAPWPVMPDLGDEDKLRRAVNDALTIAKIIKDDALVIGGMTWKRWAKTGEAGGVLIVVRTAPDVRRIEEREACWWWD